MGLHSRCDLLLCHCRLTPQQAAGCCVVTWQQALPAAHHTPRAGLCTAPRCIVRYPKPAPLALPFPLALSLLHGPLPHALPGVYLCCTCSVYSVQAKSLQVSGIDGLAAPGMWVDFGLRSLAVGLVVPEVEDQDSQPDPELMNFMYGERRSAGWMAELR